MLLFYEITFIKASTGDQTRPSEGRGKTSNSNNEKRTNSGSGRNRDSEWLESTFVTIPNEENVKKCDEHRNTRPM